MCGRYAVRLLAEVLELPFVEESEFPELELPWAHYNVCPGTTAPIVDSRGVLRPALWGLVPHWSKSPPRRPLFNARLETAATRSSFRTAWASQRCLVPSSGFYEWSDRAGGRRPYFVPPREKDQLLWLAGLASQVQTANGPLWTYTVLTESSQGTPVWPYHDRVPVILAPQAVAAWLGGSGTQPGLRGDLGDPYPVSTRVNAAAHNEPSNIERVEP
jgi:putative SOS response-associated peptidase YedK